MDKRDQRVHDNVAQHGWHVVKVMEDEKGPGFGFTIGLFKTYGHPEIIIFGLELTLIHRILNCAGEVIKTGNKFKPAQTSDELIGGYPCEFREVPERWHRAYLGTAIWFYNHAPFPVLQCFWPDKNGQFPWQREFNEKLKGLQPLLFNY